MQREANRRRIGLITDIGIGLLHSSDDNFHQASHLSPSSALSLTDKDILEAIKTFPAGSTGGLDGLRPQHIKDMTSPITGIAGKHLVTSLAEFANMCLAGCVPASVRPVFYGASLCFVH